MTGRLDLDAIRRDNPLPDIAGKLVRLRPAGREWVGDRPGDLEEAARIHFGQGQERRG